MSQYVGPVLLDKSHHVSGFDCGKDELNRFLVKNALHNQSADSARTFVTLREDRVVGYYSLATSAVAYEGAPSRMSTGLARHDIPVILMARFAVDRDSQGCGLGKALFKDALKRHLKVVSDVGARAFVVHAKDDEAKSFYEYLGMQQFPGNPLHLFYLQKDIVRTLAPT